VGGDTEDAPTPQWRVKYVRVVNNTGAPLTVFARTNATDKPRDWTFKPGEEGVLSVGDAPLALASLYIWAKAGDQEWGEYKDSPLELVSEPYEADDIDTYTFPFPPAEDED
jgi:hypothetical protein